MSNKLIYFSLVIFLCDVYLSDIQECFSVYFCDFFVIFAMWKRSVPVSNAFELTTTPRTEPVEWMNKFS